MLKLEFHKIVHRVELNKKRSPLLLPLIVGYCIKHQKNAVFHKEKYRTVFPDLLVSSLQMNTFHSELNRFHNPRRMVYPDQLQFHRNDKYISYCCDYVYNRLSIESKNTLAIISAGKRYVLHYHEILYVEARSHCIYISTTITSAPLKINANLSDIVSSLPQELFIPCHRSYIVNVAHIRLVTRTECLLSRNISIPISRTYTLSVNQAFDRYHQGGIYNYGVDNI